MYVLPVGVAGYQLSPTSAQALIASASPAEPPLCPFGTYFAGGPLNVTAASTCQACPFGTTTQQQGSTSVLQCQVPPGAL
jgi:hypothetical protein